MTKRKERIHQGFSKLIVPTKIIIVKKEIESWYLAGITPEGLKTFQLLAKNQRISQEITKEVFEAMRPKSFPSTTDFLIEALKFYSLKIGTKNNHSLLYFSQKYQLAS